MNWTQAVERSLSRLRACLSDRPGREFRTMKFDLIASGTSIYSGGYLLPLMHALSGPRTRVLLAPSVSEQKFTAKWSRFVRRFFEWTVVHPDRFLTSAHRSSWAPFCDGTCPLYEVFGPVARNRKG
ncbi:unnamed protein product, partial [Symbiodinium microadriaticum]